MGVIPERQGRFNMFKLINVIQNGNKMKDRIPAVITIYVEKFAEFSTH